MSGVEGMNTLKNLKKAKYLIGLTIEEKSYLLPVLALYCLEKEKITCGEIQILVDQTRQKLMEK